MGAYLNSMDAITTYREVCNSPYFVDKSQILNDIVSRIATTEKYVCVTRPRRFGKTIMANMIASFLSKGCDSYSLFEHLSIGEAESVMERCGKYDVIHMTLNEIPRHCDSYERYIERIETKLVRDITQAFPEVAIDESDAVWDVLKCVYDENPTQQFIFVIDEWDYIFHRDFVDERGRSAYIDFLSNLLKGKPYVAFCYMTGILPISKYSSGSELNMFLEYTMVSEELFGDSFGFTEREVDMLFARYQAHCYAPVLTRDALRDWYDGYCTQSGERVYNPRSVVAALTNNHLGNYWTSSGPYDEIFYYIEHNVDEVRDDLALMVSGESVSCKVREYAATSMNLSTKDEIFSAMVVYGFLCYERGRVRIPNKELAVKFEDMLYKETSLGYVYRLARSSKQMMDATIAADTQTMTDILEYAHDTETP